MQIDAAIRSSSRLHSGESSCAVERSSAVAAAAAAARGSASSAGSSSAGSSSSASSATAPMQAGGGAVRAKKRRSTRVSLKFVIMDDSLDYLDYYLVSAAERRKRSNGAMGSGFCRRIPWALPTLASTLLELHS